MSCLLFYPYVSSPLNLFPYFPAMLIYWQWYVLLISHTLIPFSLFFPQRFIRNLLKKTLSNFFSAGVLVSLLCTLIEPAVHIVLICLCGISVMLSFLRMGITSYFLIFLSQCHTVDVSLLIMN